MPWLSLFRLAPPGDRHRAGPASPCAFVATPSRLLRGCDRPARWGTVRVGGYHARLRVSAVDGEADSVIAPGHSTGSNSDASDSCGWRLANWPECNKLQHYCDSGDS